MRINSLRIVCAAPPPAESPFDRLVAVAYDPRPWWCFWGKDWQDALFVYQWGEWYDTVSSEKLSERVSRRMTTLLFAFDAQHPEES